MLVTSTFNNDYLLAVLEMSTDHLLDSLAQKEEYNYKSLSELHRILCMYEVYLRPAPVPLKDLNGLDVLLHLAGKLDSLPCVSAEYPGMLELIRDIALKLKLSFIGDDTGTIISFVTSLHQRPQYQLDRLVTIWNSQIMAKDGKLPKDASVQELAATIYNIHYEGTASEKMINSIIRQFLDQ